LHEGVPDLSYIEDAVRVLGRFVRPGATVVLESTTYPGTTDELVAALLEEVSGLTAGRDFHVGYSPERIDPGNTVWQFENTPKVVSGINETSLAAVQGFYDTLVAQTVPVGSTQVAELAKLLENTFRQVNIALVNELAMFARELGISLWEAVDAAATKPYGFMKFTPGPGVGGHCLPIDPSYLSWRVKRSTGRNFRFVELANDINDHMPEYVLHRLVEALNHRGRPVKDSRILLLGLAYKRNTGDARESPARRVIELLIGLGADIHAVDPYVVEAHVDPRVRRVELSPQEVAAADAVVLLTDHDSLDTEMVVENAHYVLDCRRALPQVSDVVEVL
jgi:UDP-N-acetyl-D-glucosamine dehydrogenase